MDASWCHSHVHVLHQVLRHFAHVGYAVFVPVLGYTRDRGRTVCEQCLYASGPVWMNC